MTATDEKAARLAAALRANLQRRKGRARDVAAAETEGAPPFGADDAASPDRQ